jgi:hypothetical protein
MARVYAGIMGSLAMTVVICRGLVAAGGVEGTLTSAVLSLIVFAVVGAAIGYIAQTTVDEAVRQKLEAELAGGTTPAGSRADSAP